MTSEGIFGVVLLLAIIIYHTISLEKDFRRRYRTGELIHGKVYSGLSRVLLIGGGTLVILAFLSAPGILYGNVKQGLANNNALTILLVLYSVTIIHIAIVSALGFIRRMCARNKAAHHFSVGDKTILRYEYPNKRHQETYEDIRKQYGSGPFTVVETFEITPDGFYVSEHHRWPYDRTRKVDPLGVGQHVKLLMISPENEQHVKEFIEKNNRGMPPDACLTFHAWWLLPY